MKIEFVTPKEVTRITETLQKADFQAYLVGGCVRDLILGKTPKDWDITTNAKPDEIVALFPKTFYENTYGTVTVVNEDTESPTLKNVEITPYRQETVYSDKRHPDAVSFSDKLEDDLRRRDFTINALAYDPSNGQLVDLYEGIKDLRDKTIRAVGTSDERFQEDALRILRAVRFTAQLGFTINPETEKSMLDNVSLLKHVSAERIRDEFNKILLSANPMLGLNLSQKLGILRQIMPELEAGIDMEQKGDHIYTVWEHSLRALQHAADRDWPLHIRLASLLHDIGKPPTRRWNEEKHSWTFYGHEVVGERIAKKILTRLKYSNKITEITLKLIRYHMFFSDTEKLTLSAVRRVIVNVGRENIWELMDIRACDRIGMGRPKENPYRLRQYKAMIDEALLAPTSVGLLKIDGQKIMEVIKETPGPKIGFILNALLEEALEKPEINNENYLKNRVKELAILPIEALKKLGEGGKQKKEEVEKQQIKQIHKKHGVE